MNITSQAGTILIVDPDPARVRPLVGCLQESGFDVMTAASGVMTLDLLSRHAIDLVVLDQLLPGHGPSDLLTEIRQHYSKAALPVIVRSTSDAPADILADLRRGANDSINLNENLELILGRIQSYVEFKRTTAELHATKNALSRVQRKLDFDLQAAARIQKNQMPSSDLFIDGWEVAWQSVPCETLGGDSLNVIRLDEDNWAFYVLDVSGHGVPASLLAVSVTRILTPARDGSGRHDTILPPRPLGDVRGSQESPSVASAVYVLERLQEKFVPEEDSVQFFTIVYATLNARTGEMRVASAGHPSPVLKRRGKPPELFRSPDGPAIGLIPLEADIHFHEAELHLDPGDMLLLYSDGVVEAFNPEEQLFGTARLQSCMLNYADRPLGDVVAGICAHTHEWRQTQPQKDDETLLAIRRAE